MTKHIYHIYVNSMTSFECLPSLALIMLIELGIFLFLSSIAPKFPKILPCSPKLYPWQQNRIKCKTQSQGSGSRLMVMAEGQGSC